MSELSVSFEVELEKRDLLRGYLRTIALYGAGARLLPIVVALVALVAVDAALALATGRPLEEHHVGFGVAFVVVGAVFTILLRAVSGRVYRSLPSPRSSWTIDDAAGVRVASAGREERLPFSAFEGASRDGGAYYLYSSRTAFRIVPRRALTEEGQATLEKILVRRLPRPPKVPGGRWVTYAAAAGLVAIFLWARAR